jgi:hypothetical protein
MQIFFCECEDVESSPVVKKGNISHIHIQGNPGFHAEVSPRIKAGKDGLPIS